MPSPTSTSRTSTSRTSTSPTGAQDGASVSRLTVWRLGEDVSDPSVRLLAERAARAVEPEVTGWALVSWPVGRPAPRIDATGPDAALDPSCWHLLFGGLLMAPLLDVRTGAPFREPPPRRTEVAVFVNQVRDLAVPGSCLLAVVGRAADVHAAADTVHGALGARTPLVAATIALSSREAAAVAAAFLDPEPRAASA
ncbi:hypothetical protein [Nocardioides sp.]|uniref:hypothetical protein n=1 Tax=Nocardioides sp. TaxID=35761 RepID=UPI0037830090